MILFRKKNITYLIAANMDSSMATSDLLNYIYSNQDAGKTVISVLLDFKNSIWLRLPWNFTENIDFTVLFWNGSSFTS